MRKQKKGIAPVIAWVLLLSLTITMGVFVTRWYLARTEGMTESTVNSLSGGIECSDVNINVAYTGTPANCNIKVSNTGSFRISRVLINDFMINYDRNPKEYQNYTQTDITDICSNDKITIIPVLQRDTGLINCPNTR